MLNSNYFQKINVLMFFIYTLIWGLSTLNLIPPLGSYFNILYAVTSLTFSLISLYVSLFSNILKSYFKIPALIIAIALLCDSVGDIFWLILGLSSDYIGYPSVPDIWYVLFYPTLFFGIHLLFLYASNTVNNAKKALIPVSISFIIAFTIGIFVSIKYLYVDVLSLVSVDLPFIFDLAYMLFDVLLLVHTFILLAFISHASKLDPSLLVSVYYIGISLVLVFLADVVFSYTTETGLYNSESPVELIFLISMLFLSNAVIKITKLTSPYKTK